MKPRLSAFVVVRNEIHNIDRCLRSLAFCDEIIVVDQQSTDATVKYAKKYTNKIYHDKLWGYPEPSRILAEKKCKGDWLLAMDADEEITPELKKEILHAIAHGTADAYEIQRAFMFMGKRMRHIEKGDVVLRLHRKGAVKYGTLLHDFVHPEPGIKIQRLKSPMNHYTHPSFRQWKDKMDRYTTYQAKSDHKYHVFPRKHFGVFVTPLLYFIYNYIYHLGILDGYRGLLLSFASVYYEFLIYKKVWFPPKVSP